MTILETKNLKYVYAPNTPFEKTAVKGLNIKIEQGEVLGLIGHTGSGKSTLIQMFNGLIKPSSGEIYLDGKNIWDEPKKMRALRFKVGMVFQYPEYQLFEETVIKDIAFGPKNMGLSEAEALKKAREAAQFVELPYNLLEKSPFELSGGEKRRVAIAGVLAMDPEVLVLDEPTAGLDPRGQEMLLSQIMKYHETRKNTIVWVSHSMEDIGTVADRVLVMNQGEMVMLDETKKVFARGVELRKIGLKVPQITHIMGKLYDLGLDVDKGCLKVNEALEQIIPLLKGDLT
ncbi:MAG: energy-coupling factor transporter ATPase [Clostridia bacterium]